MDGSKTKLESWRMVGVIICVAILLGGGWDALTGLRGMGAFGYTSGYEGVRASFAGIEWNNRKGSGKQDLVGTSFFFDPDSPSFDAPNLVGEMTNAFVPEESVKPSWIFPDFWEKAEYIRNPIDRDEWNLPNPEKEDEIIAYVMEEWLLKMYVSITCEWDKSPTYWKQDKESSGGTRYMDTKVWIELDISPIWYFEGADQVYFGLGKVVCSDFTWGKFGKTEEDYTKTFKGSVAPESTTSYRYLYYSKYGTTQFSPTNPKMFQGRELNPEIFVDRMFFHVDLTNFGTESWTDVLRATHYKGDAVTWGFDVHVFVVGEWKVQDIEEIPEDYGREPMEEMGWTYYVAKMLGDPRTQFWLILGMIALVFLFLLIFAPWVLIAIFGIVSASRRKG